MGLALKQDPDPALCTRVGESPSIPERSADCGASTGEEGWGPGSESGAGGPGCCRGACLQIFQTGVTAVPGRGKVGPGWGSARFHLGYLAFILASWCVDSRLWSAARSRLYGYALGGEVRDDGQWPCHARVSLAGPGQRPGSKLTSLTGLWHANRDSCSVSAAIGFEWASTSRTPFPNPHPIPFQGAPTVVVSHLRTCSCTEDHLH